MHKTGIPIDKISSIEWMLVPLLIVLVSYAIIRHMYRMKNKDWARNA